MSDLAATNCGCGEERSGCPNNGCCGFGGLSNLFNGGSCNCILWILILLCCCGNGFGGGDCDGDNNCWLIILLLLCCGNGFGGGCGC